MHGVRDDEMTARWVQLGVFSPLNRLHSTDNPFNGKEPWKYNTITQSVMEEFLRLRHKLVPYEPLRQQGRPAFGAAYVLAGAGEGGDLPCAE